MTSRAARGSALQKGNLRPHSGMVTRKIADPRVSGSLLARHARASLLDRCCVSDRLHVCSGVGYERCDGMTELEWTIGVLEELLFEERDDPESLSNGYGKALRNAIAVLIGMNQRELADVLATTKALRPIWNGRPGIFKKARQAQR